MRNLKRALSLLLSSTLVLGMLVMGGSAAGYQDVDASNKNQEAIEVLQTVGIMTGDQNGNFNPDGSITRNEMAVVMAHLLNLDYDYYRGTNPFTDVPEWAAPYVAACAAEGVVAGIGNGQFGGDQKVTAAQASLMIMKALGYFQNAEDFGSDWQVATIRQASYINLFANINSDADSALTRGQVAQLVLNGLKAKMVDFTGDKGIQIGDVTVGYRAEYSYKTSAAGKYNTIDDGTTNIAENDQYYIQLGEELYNGDLKLNSHSADAFARPSRTWSFKGEEIGTYVNYDLMVAEYTTSVTGKEVYEAVGKTAFDKYDFASYVDGADSNLYKDISKDNKGDVDETHRGALTQVFVNDDTKDVVVTVINTYLAKANADYSEKKDSVTFGIYEDSKSTTLNKTVSGEDFDIADIKKDDFVLVNYSYETEEIEVISDVEILSNVEISKFSTDGTATSVTVDGTKYDDSNKLFYDEKDLEQYANTNLKDTTFNVYLDRYGYVIGIDIVEGANNYVFITGIDKDHSNLVTKNYQANAIFMDGTSKVIEVKNNDTIKNVEGNPVLNRWFKYSVNSDSVYTLTAVADKRATDSKDAAQAWTGADDVKEINDKHISLNSQNGKIYGNDESVYLLADLDKVWNGTKDYAVIAGASEVVTGIDNTSFDVWNYEQAADDVDVSAGPWEGNASNGTYALYDDDNYVIAAVVVGESGINSTKIAYVNSGALKDESYDKTTDMWTRTREVIINGESVLLQEVRDDNETDLKDMQQYAWYTIKYDAEGNVKDVELYDNSNNQNVTYFDDLNEAVKAIEKDEKDTIVVELGDAPTTGVGKELTLIGKTLYNNTEKEEGFRIAEDVNVVLVQTVKNQTTTTDEAGVDALASILKDLNEKTVNGQKYNYEFSAVIEQGRATSVVIIDNNKQGAGQGPDGGQGNGKLDILNLTFDKDSKTFSSTVGAKVEIPADCKWTMNVYQGNYKVATKTDNGGAQSIGATFSLTTNVGSVISASGTYTVEVIITADNFVASDIAEFAI